MTNPSTTDLELSLQHLVARLRFRHLQMLTALDETGSLRAAARQVHLTQPALSKAVNEIESAFGRPLFTRTARGLTATASGQLVIQGARLLLRQLAHVHEDVGISEQVKATLRIGATPFMVQSQLPRVLKKLTTGEASLRIHIMEDRAPRLMNALSDGELDAAITTYPKQQEHLQGFRYDTIFEAGLTVIAAPSHPLAALRKVGWAALASQDWILPQPSSMMRHEIENSFRKASTLPPIPVIESTSPVSNVHLVAANIGISVVPAAIAQQALKTGLVKRLAVTPAIPRQPVALIYREALQNPHVLRLRRALSKCE